MKTSKKEKEDMARSIIDGLDAAPIVVAVLQIFRHEASRVDMKAELADRKGERFPVIVSAYRIDNSLPVRVDIRIDAKARAKNQTALFPGVVPPLPRDDRDPPGAP